MSEKSRGNWQVSVCLKFDCVNRDKKCEDCIGFSHYIIQKDKTSQSSSSN